MRLVGGGDHGGRSSLLMDPTVHRLVAGDLDAVFLPSHVMLAVFPFRHRLELTITLRPDGLILETGLVAGLDDPVPVSFGFHPYFGLPELPRGQWRLKLPAMRRLILDQRGIPTGEEQPFGGF